jgi:hypothetical protein
MGFVGDVVDSKMNNSMTKPRDWIFFKIDFSRTNRCIFCRFHFIHHCIPLSAVLGSKRNKISFIRCISRNTFTNTGAVERVDCKVKKLAKEYNTWDSNVDCKVKKLAKEYNTWDSNVVPHRSTNQARTCLTSLSGREAVLSCWYGRIRQHYTIRFIQNKRMNNQT